MNEFLDSSTLKTVCDPVMPGDSVGHIIAKMWLAVQHGKGIGLAANQVGETKRIIIVCTKDFRQVFINPEITKKFGGTVNSKEGCLSFPGKQVLVVRSRGIIVEGVDEFFKPVKFRLNSLAGIVVQHEVDHLDGITCVDKAAKILR